jgi:acetylornithine deacetylase/succinyl-diaminopimelate desuccinylase-like protein
MTAQKPEWQYVDAHFEEFVSELREAVRKPSIAAQNIGMAECAEYFKRLLESYGVQARAIPTAGHPVVFGEIEGKDKSKTVLFYDHYDVQPPDPLDEWESDPFAGDIRDGKMYGRGVSDNKGNACARIQAVGTLLRLRGELPVNVKFLIEGEEEIGSTHLAEFIRDNKSLLRADYGVWESGYMSPNGRPGMYLGVKGILYIELEAQGPSRDMHSGSAATVPNPAWRLVWALSTIKNEKEEILIPGFYDAVLSPTEREMELIRAAVEGRQGGASREDRADRKNQATAPTAATPRRQYGIHSPLADLSPLDLRVRSLFGPTANICGFRSGYLGEGQKTVLPAKALVKMDFRLVPEQDPEDIYRKLRKHLDDNGFDDVKTRVITMDYPVKTSADHPVVKAAEEAALAVYGKPPSIAPTQGGSGPMHPFKEYLNLPMVAFGVGYWGSGNHGPNENIRLEDYRQGIKMAMEFIDRLRG